jgi:hypothetical protein
MMARFWSDGLPVEVASNHLGAPEQLRIQGHAYLVTTVVMRWRIRQHWWRMPIWREYFVIIAPGPLLLRIYHDLPRGGWYVEFLYD